MEKYVPEDLHVVRLRGPGRDMVGNVATGTITRQVNVDLRILPAPQPTSCGDPLEGGPAVVVGAGVPVLGRSTVIHGDDDRPANAGEAAAEGVVDGTVGGGVGEAAAVEEEYDGDDLDGVEGLFEVDNSPLGLVLRGRLVDPVEQPRGAVDVVE